MKSPTLAVGTDVRRVGRIPRNPQHRWYTASRPFAIQPIMIAPVLPGETLKSAVFQSRVITDPIKNSIMGWWQEYYYFYVKLRDLTGRADFTEAMVDLEKDLSAYEEAASTEWHHFGGINWTKLCLERVVEEYFRNPDEAWNAYLIGNMPAAAINQETWTNSAALSDAYTPLDVNVDQNADTTITASEVENSIRTWQFMRANGLTEMDYEDYLRTHGIRIAPEETHRPELVRYVREWSYPTNTVEPSDGSVASAVSWAVAGRFDKDRFFKEPGFLVGYSLTRPKVYIDKSGGSAASMMDNALTWLPAVMKDDPYSSLRKYAETAGPLAGVVTDTDGYWIDVRDLLVHGDDFTNVAKTAANMNVVGLPSADLVNRWYPSGTDADALFTGTAKTIRQDGVINLTIMGSQMDMTPLSTRP